MLTPFKSVTPSFSIKSLAHPFERDFPSSFASVGEFYEFIEICFLQSGKAEFVIEEKVFLAESGTLFIYAPMHLHKFRGLGNSPLKLYTLSMMIEGSLPDGIYDTIFSLDSELQERFLSAFKKARDFLEDKVDDTVGVLASLELQSLIIDICRNQSPRKESLSTGAANTYKSIIETMQKEVFSNLSLGEIAKRLNISLSYLKVLFAKYNDLSPKEYYRKLRLHESILLLHKDITITKIAETMNFSYPNHFTQFFKKETGLSPTEYKAKMLKNDR